MNNQKGFTLIELMIVIAIIGILASIAIPQYQNYVARAQLSEAISLIDGVKTALTENMLQTSQCPANATASAGGIDVSTSISGSYVLSVATGGTYSATGDSCTITATMKNDVTTGTGTSATTTSVNVAAGIKGKKVQMQASQANTGSITWKCVSDADAKYLPSICSNGTIQ